MSNTVDRRTILALVFAVVAALNVYLTWGGVDRPGLYHDEKAYLLQSRIYTDGKFSEPPPPVPELWEQIHVFTEPRYASRYPPGFPAVLALGTAIGAPGLVLILLAGATAAVLFLFGARLFGEPVAALGTALWVASPANTAWRAAYFSESLTCLLWLTWCWLAWRYRDSGRRRDLVLVSLLVAFAGISRPVTAMALALPLVVILWPRLRQAAGRRDALAAALAGALICAVVPFWNHAVLGSWTTVPYAEYSARTFPFDMPTWHTNWSPPPRELPPDMNALGDAQRVPYQQRTLAGLPAVFAQRADRLGVAALPRGFGVLRILAPIGLLLAGGAGAVALGSALLLLLAHLTMPHPPEWTIYYLDVFPVVAFGAAILLVRGVAFVMRRAPAMAPGAAGQNMAMVASAIFVALGATWGRPASADTNRWMKDEMYFRAGACALPAGPRIIFVQRRNAASPHHSLVDNDPRWARSDRWVVRAWTPLRNRALMAVAPERAAYYYDENAGWFARMNADGTPSRDGVVNVQRVPLEAGHDLACR